MILHWNTRKGVGPGDVERRDLFKVFFEIVLKWLIFLPGHDPFGYPVKKIDMVARMDSDDGSALVYFL